MQTRDLLERLVSFDTVSRNPNRELMQFVAQWLDQQRIQSFMIPNHDGSKANLYATACGTGPLAGDSKAAADSPVPNDGVLLSGHTDVVPVEGQAWTVPAFQMVEQNRRYYGRGTTDMKGFVACALTAMAKAQKRPLQTPLHLALSYDEEIGCVGVRSLVDHLAQLNVRPRLCIVGEPTEMSVATRHKGKIATRATFTGREGHSALAPLALNAIYLACDFVSYLQTLQTRLAKPYEHLDATQIPYTTVHTGIIQGGTAMNIVPNRCTVDFEIRNPAEDDPEALLREIQSHAQHSVQQHLQRVPEASVQFERLNDYPGLNTPEDSWAVSFVKSLTGANGCTEVAFGTEAGLFSQNLTIPSVVCGPGSMNQGHKPDEYISIDQMDQCEHMLDRLLGKLCKPEL